MKTSRRRRKRFERILPKPELIISEHTAPPPVPITNLEPSRAKERPVYAASEEDNEAFVRVVDEVLEATDLDFEVVYEHEDYQRAFITIEERQAGALIGRRGANIDALELLLGRMTSHQVGHNVPVQIDVNEYRKRLEDELREMALERARAVRDNGDDEHLPVMNPRDRRIVHLAIEKLEGLETYTMGEGSTKHVVIHKTD